VYPAVFVGMSTSDAFAASRERNERLALQTGPILSQDDVFAAMMKTGVSPAFAGSQMDCIYEMNDEIRRYINRNGWVAHCDAVMLYKSMVREDKELAAAMGSEFYWKKAFAAAFNKIAKIIEVYVEEEMKIPKSDDFYPSAVTSFYPPGPRADRLDMGLGKRPC